MTRGFLLHPCGGEFPQLVVDEREQIGGGPAVAGRSSIEQTGDIGHDGRVYRPVAAESHENEGDRALPLPDRYQLLNDVSFLAVRSIAHGPAPQEYFVPGFGDDV